MTKVPYWLLMQDATRRHTGGYDDTLGPYKGQGASAEIVGPFVRIKGTLPSPFHDDPSPAKNGGTGPSFDRKFGTHFMTWTLRSWDLDRFPEPITVTRFSPTATTGRGFTEGGFDALRQRVPADPYCCAWSWDVLDQNGQYPPGNPAHPAFGFRHCEIEHFVSDVLGEAHKAGIPLATALHDWIVARQ